MFVYAADVAESIHHAATYQLAATLDGVDWPTLVERVFGRIDPIAAGGEDYRRGQDHVTVYSGTARFVDHRVLEVDGERITADHIVLGVGSRPTIPDIPGLDAVPYHTSDTIMRVERVPERLVVLGAGFIGAELGHVFSAFGSNVTIATRGRTMLSAEDPDIAVRFTEVYESRFDVLLHTRDLKVESVDGDGRFVLSGSFQGETGHVEGDALLIAIGRTPNGDQLDLARTGLALDDDGRIVVDKAMETTEPGIWSFGDACNPYQLKHVANAEAKIVFHNILHPDDRQSMDYR